MLQTCFKRASIGGARGGGREEGVTPPPIISPQKQFFLFVTKFPEGDTAAAGRQKVLKGGRKAGRSSPPSKKTGRKAPHNNLVR